LPQSLRAQGQQGINCRCVFSATLAVIVVAVVIIGGVTAVVIFVVAVVFVTAATVRRSAAIIISSTSPGGRSDNLLQLGFFRFRTSALSLIACERVLLRALRP
jgi:hypothetical protein